MAGDEGGDKGQEGVETSREVDVHVGHDGGVAPHPGLLERPPAPLLLEVEEAHAGQLGGEPAGDTERVVRTGVVGDGHDGREGERRVEVGAQGADALLETARFVEDRHHDIEHGGHGNTVAVPAPGSLGLREETPPILPPAQGARCVAVRGAGAAGAAAGMRRE